MTTCDPLNTLENPIFRRLMKSSVNAINIRRLGSRLQEQVSGVEESGPDVTVTGLCGDSRRVSPGDLFVSPPGDVPRCSLYIKEALERGAVAVVSDGRVADLSPGVAAILVQDVRKAKASVACEFFGHPSSRLRLIGITGTNGKTTTAFMLRSILTMNGDCPGVLGTLGAYLGSDHEPLVHTTPDAIDLQHYLARMVDANLSTVVLEVSSHALDQYRVYGTQFNCGVFTNLSTDHLDYHRTMEEYANAKARLFRDLPSDSVAVLNGGDPLSDLFEEVTSARTIRYALDQDGDIRGEVARLDDQGTVLSIQQSEKSLAMACTLRFVGRHNAMNALAAASAALALGLPPTAIRTGLESLSAVPGRLEPVDCGQDFRVFVDYAHTPDALDNVVGHLSSLTQRKLHVVFGCGGNRDRTKRPLMAVSVASGADYLYVTSDNPRDEDPEVILDEVFDGIPHEKRGETYRIVDRKEAILAACSAAEGGDIVLIAGKGHETTQTIGGEAIPFDDRTVAREILWSL